ncbi:ABC transporter permease subunit [Phytohabitans kaempferiae]|uniref:ABC transporter permease subunit n=1 Tax=Phytohabitans kaempferiae TaxID=1620943 RepID=A0ABV6M5S4_9ACTN
MNLVLAELSRLVSRRFMQLMAVLLIGAFGITVATTVTNSHRPTEAEWQQAEDHVRFAEARIDEIRRECEQRALTPGFCDAYSEQQPRIEDYLYGVFVFSAEITDLTYFMIAFLALFAFLVAASFIGAELTSGGMTNLLLWRPRRTVVLGTKLATVLAAVLAVSVVATALYIGAFYAIAEVGGVPGDVDAEFWGDLALTVVRGLALVLFAAAVGFGAATLGRHTAAALGLIATYAIVWEVGARIVFSVLEAGRSDRYMLTSYLGAWMTGEISFYDPYVCGSRIMSVCDGRYELTWAHAGGVFAIVLAVMVGGAFATFRHRDLA